jgi:hypothetical protein
MLLLFIMRTSLHGILEVEKMRTAVELRSLLTLLGRRMTTKTKIT